VTDRTITRRVVWTRDRRAPTVKLDDLDFDRLVVHVEGDATDTFVFTPDFGPFRHHPGPPEHWTLKVAPHLCRMFREDSPTRRADGGAPGNQ
jgi:hypothetical protein